jgi:hypothetical protein
MRNILHIFGFSKGTENINHSISEEALFSNDKKLTQAAGPHVEIFRLLRNQCFHTNLCSEWQSPSESFRAIRYGYFQHHQN